MGSRTRPRAGGVRSRAGRRARGRGTGIWAGHRDLGGAHRGEREGVGTQWAGRGAGKGVAGMWSSTADLAPGG